MYQIQYTLGMKASDIVSSVIERSGVRKAHLSRRSGVSRALIDAYLAEERQPSMAQIERLASSVGLRVTFDVQEAADADRHDEAPPARTPRRSEQRSLWLHRAIVGHLVKEPDRVVSIARANIERWRRERDLNDSLNHAYDEWSAILDAGVEAITRACLSEDEKSIDLRQSNPFPGVLSEEERASVLASFNAHWRQMEQAAGKTLP